MNKEREREREKERAERRRMDGGQRGGDGG
jgi:hypothetical protein